MELDFWQQVAEQIAEDAVDEIKKLRHALAETRGQLLAARIFATVLGLGYVVIAALRWLA